MRNITKEKIKDVALRSNKQKWVGTLFDELEEMHEKLNALDEKFDEVLKAVSDLQKSSKASSTKKAKEE